MVLSGIELWHTLVDAGISNLNSVNCANHGNTDLDILEEVLCHL